MVAWAPSGTTQAFVVLCDYVFLFIVSFVTFVCVCVLSLSFEVVVFHVLVFCVVVVVVVVVVCSLWFVSCCFVSWCVVCPVVVFVGAFVCYAILFVVCHLLSI